MSGDPRLLEDARRLQAAGHIDEAAHAYRASLAADPDPRVMDALGQMFAAAGRLDEARSAYDDALRLHPDNDMLCVRAAMLALQQQRRVDAATLLRRALDIRPGRLQPLRTLAALLFELGRYEEALPHMREIASLRPRAAEEHVNLARTLIALRHFDEAAGVATHATELKADSLEAWITRALALMEVGDFESAVPAFEHAATLDPSDPRALFHLGRLYERWRRPDDARQAAEAALARAPSTGAARLLARLESRSGQPAEALQRQDRLLADALPPEERGHILIERGQALDRLQREDEAWQSFLEGQALLAPPESGVHESMRTFLDMLDRCATWPEAPVDWSLTPPPGRDPRPAPVFLVGFPRSGTTLTEQLLGAHPDFCTSDEQPLLHVAIQQLSARGRYPDIIGQIDDATAAALRDDYWHEADRLLRRAPDAPTLRLVDKQPYNTPHLAAVRRIFPDARVVTVLRDPRDACLSMLMQDVAPGQRMISYPTIEAALTVYERMMGGYLAMRERLGLAILEVRYEDVVADLEGQARRLVEFTGAAWDDAVLDYRGSAAARRSQINTESVTRAIYTTARERWRRYERHLAPFNPRLRPFLDAFGYPAK
ncbi:MAG: sulfotransferase [Phycisphaerales bacterium]|nr:sulfotransferase [Phycisphaerales bacterium]